MLAVLGPASGDLWHPLLTRLGLMNMDMVQDLIQAAHHQPNDWYPLWLERMDTLVISTPLQVIATKLFSNQTLGETWMDLVDHCYGQAYASPDAWTAETASFTKIPFVRSSFMSGSAIYERMKALSGQCRHFQRTSEGSEYTGPDEDYESTLAEWAGKARDGVYLMDLPLDWITKQLLVGGCPIHLMGFATDLNYLCQRAGLPKTDMEALAFFAPARPGGTPVGTAPHLDCMSLGVSLHTTVFGPAQSANLVTLAPLRVGELSNKTILQAFDMGCETAVKAHTPYAAPFVVSKSQEVGEFDCIRK
jgi:hypothetical protein